MREERENTAVGYGQTLLNRVPTEAGEVHPSERLDRAHGRHMAAIRSLAQVRKLALPTPADQVQINMASNVAQQQIVEGDRT